MSRGFSPPRCACGSVLSYFDYVAEACSDCRPLSWRDAWLAAWRMIGDWVEHNDRIKRMCA